jgi:1-acyl-sn-glycerol-3-phosphate acyltransferase
MSEGNDAAAGDCAELDVHWARRRPARLAREALLSGFFGPAMTAYVRRRVRGREVLRDLAGPVIFVANHSSHMDTPAILRALPARWRRGTAVAAAADYFYTRRSVAGAVSLMFNTFPVRRDGGGLDPGAAAHVDALISEGWSLLLYAEGTRSRDGSVGRLRSGAAVLAARHGLPLVPIHVAGTREAMPHGEKWMARAPGRLLGRRWPVHITFGAPIRARHDEHRSQIMERVRLFLAESGARTTPAERPPAPVAAPVREPAGRP